MLHEMLNGVEATVHSLVQRVGGRWLALLVVFVAVVLVSRSATAQLRVVTYNTAGGPNPGLEDVLAAIGPIDVLALQEQRALATTTAAIAEMLSGIYGARVYMPGTLEGGTTRESTGRPGLIYNTTTVQLIGEETVGADSTTGQPRQTLRYQLRPAGYGPSADFYVYNSHYKAGTGPDNRDRRNVEAVAIRADLDGLGDGVHAILAGDFNVYRSDEPMYLTLTAGGYGKAVDPLRLPGRWSDSERFKAIHTQAPAVSPNGDGGMDDRFDFQLVTEELLDDEGLDYIEDSYRAFGNDGSHTLNGNISTGTAEPPDVLTALMTASDHLPVVADYQLPALLEVITGEVPPTLSLGQPFSLELTIRNAAPVDVPLGADELDYMLTISGSLFGSDSEGEVLALSEGDAHSFELDTSSVGIKSGTVLITSNGQGVASGLVEIPVAYEVVAGLPGDYNGNGLVDQADLDLVLSHWGSSQPPIPPGWNGAPPVGLVDQEELDHVLAGWGTAVAVGHAAPAPSAATTAMFCAVVAVAMWRRFGRL